MTSKLWRTAAGLAGFLRRRGQVEEAESLYHSAISAMEEFYGPDRPLVARILRRFAFMLRHQGRQKINARKQTPKQRQKQIAEQVFKQNAGQKENSQPAAN